MRALRIVHLLVLLSAVNAAGCARQPRTAATSSPAPAGAGAIEETPTAPAATKAPEAPVAPAGADKIEPAAPAVAPPKPEVRQFAPTTRLRDIHFDFDAYEIRPEDSKILDADADWMHSNPNYIVLIEGHCDERGTNEYNLALGEQRARAALNYLLTRGVQARITTLSYGEERPLCIERTEACWAKNRRAHFLVKLATPAR